MTTDWSGADTGPVAGTVGCTIDVRDIGQVGRLCLAAMLGGILAGCASGSVQSMPVEAPSISAQSSLMSSAQWAEEVPESVGTQAPLIQDLAALAARHPDKVRWNAISHRMEPLVGAMMFQHSRAAFQQWHMQLPKAERSLRQALREYVEIFGADSLPVGATLWQLSNGFLWQGRLPLSLKAGTEAYHIQARHLGAGRPELRPYLHTLGMVYAALGNLEEARKQYQEALELPAMPGPEDVGVRAMLHEQVARLDQIEDRLIEAAAQLAEARKLREQVFSPDSQEMAPVFYYQGLQWLNQWQFEDAERSFRQALALIEKAPDNPAHAQYYDQLGLALFGQRRFTEARDLFERASKQCRRMLGENHHLTVSVWQNLARAHLYQGNDAEADRLYTWTHTKFVELLGLRHQRTGQSFTELALLRLMQTDFAAAAPLIDEALRIGESSFVDSHPANVDALTLQTVLRHLQGRPEDAEAVLQRALSAAGTASKPAHLRAANSFRALGDLYHARGRSSEAEQMYLRSLSLQEQHLGTSHAQVGYTLERLSRVFAARHESAKAADALQRAIEVHEQSLGAAHRAVGDDLSALGRLYLGLGRYGAAEAALRRAISIHQQSLPQDNAAILMDRDGLAQALRLQQRESKPCSRTPPCRG